MGIGDILTTVQQNVVQAMFSGGPLTYFMVVLGAALLWGYFKAVTDVWQDRVKEAVKANLLNGTLLFLALAIPLFTHRYITMFIVLVVGGGWFLLKVMRPAYRRKWPGILAAAIFIVSYASEWYIQRLHTPAHTYVVLSFENLGIGERENLVESWGHFKTVLARVFAGVSSIRVQPESVKPEVFDALAWGQKSPDQVIQAIGGAGPGRQLVLRTDVGLGAGEGTARRMTLVSMPHRLAKKQLVPLGVLDAQKGAINDVDHLALLVAVALVAKLQATPDFTMTPLEEADVMKRILNHYALFLRTRPDTPKGLIAEAEALAGKSAISREEVKTLLARYTGPQEPAPGKEIAIARRSQLVKLRVNRGTAGRGVHATVPQ